MSDKFWIYTKILVQNWAIILRLVKEHIKNEINKFVKKIVCRNVTKHASLFNAPLFGAFKLEGLENCCQFDCQKCPFSLTNRNCRVQKTNEGGNAFAHRRLPFFCYVDVPFSQSSMDLTGWIRTRNWLHGNIGLIKLASLEALFGGKHTVPSNAKNWLKRATGVTESAGWV